MSHAFVLSAVAAVALGLVAPGAAIETGPMDPTDAGEGREGLRLRISNTEGGCISSSADEGHTWSHMGRVTVPATTVSRKGFTAAAWARDGAVAATSVNAIHIKVGRDPDTGRAVIFSIVPRGTLVGAANRQASSAIGTDLAGGEGIFGWGLGPYVNSEVLLSHATGLRPLQGGYAPSEGDTLMIVCRDPLHTPRYATFENHAGGAVTLDLGEGRPLHLGRVDRPVTGVGRFEGAVYAAGGRVRANHPGVLDVDTSPLGLIGGFQIIPRRHAQSAEIVAGLPSGQWMVIGPDDPGQPDWAGLPPFFSGVFVPSYRDDDIRGWHLDWMARALSRLQVQVRYGTGSWEGMPRIAFTPRGRHDTGARTNWGRRGLWLIPAQANPGLPMSAAEKAVASTALAGVTAIRVVFPRERFVPALRPGEPATELNAVTEEE